MNQAQFIGYATGFGLGSVFLLPVIAYLVYIVWTIMRAKADKGTKTQLLVILIAGITAFLVSAYDVLAYPTTDTLPLFGSVSKFFTLKNILLQLMAIISFFVVIAVTKELPQGKD